MHFGGIYLGSNKIDNEVRQTLWFHLNRLIWRFSMYHSGFNDWSLNNLHWTLMKYFGKVVLNWVKAWHSSMVKDSSKAVFTFCYHFYLDFLGWIKHFTPLWLTFLKSVFTNYLRYVRLANIRLTRRYSIIYKYFSPYFFRSESVAISKPTNTLFYKRVSHAASSRLS